MAGQEKIRINKVLKEFNIGLGTLVEFLNKKGYEVEAHPSAQISAEEHELIRKEYAKEQLIKEESKRIAIKVKEITKKENARPEPEEESFGDEVIIKTTTIDHPSAHVEFRAWLRAGMHVVPYLIGIAFFVIVAGNVHVMASCRFKYVCLYECLIVCPGHFFYYH